MTRPPGCSIGPIRNGAPERLAFTEATSNFVAAGACAWLMFANSASTTATSTWMMFFIALSVGGRQIGAIDDEEVGGHTPRLQPESELLLQCGGERGA